MLQEYTNVLWFDSSLRFSSQYDLSAVYNFSLNNGGIVLLHYSVNTITSATDPAFFTYVPSHAPSLARVPMVNAGAFFIRNTKEIYNGVFYWWVLCALEESCISPPGAQMHCTDIPGALLGQYLVCHRFDQSVLNTLLANYHRFNTTNYVLHLKQNRKSMVYFARKREHRKTPKPC